MTSMNPCPMNDPLNKTTFKACKACVATSDITLEVWPHTTVDDKIKNHWQELFELDFKTIAPKHSKINTKFTQLKFCSKGSTFETPSEQQHGMVTFAKINDAVFNPVQHALTHIFLQNCIWNLCRIFKFWIYPNSKFKNNRSNRFHHSARALSLPLTIMLQPFVRIFSLLVHGLFQIMNWTHLARMKTWSLLWRTVHRDLAFSLNFRIRLMTLSLFSEF